MTYTIDEFGDGFRFGGEGGVACTGAEGDEFLKVRPVSAESIGGVGAIYVFENLV